MVTPQFPVPMKLHERYQQFRDPAIVKANIVRSVYASMALENQTVSFERINELYEQQRRETASSQGPKLLPD